MNTNNAMEFQASVYRLNKILSRLSEVGLNTQKYEELRDNIIRECELDVLVKDNSVSSSFFNPNYKVGIEKINMICDELVNYEVMLKLHSKIETAQSYIESKNSVDLNEAKTLIFELLDRIKDTNDLAYDSIEDLIDKLYEVIYLYIKEEVRTTGKSDILEYLKLEKNSIHKTYLDKAITKELESINLKDENNRLIKLRKSELDSNSLDANYLDEKLIRSIVFSRSSEEELEEKLKELINILDSYYKNINSLKERLDTLNNSNVFLKKNINYLKKDAFKKVLLFLTSTGLVVSLVATSFFLGKKFSSSKKYLAKKESYSTLTGKDSSIDYFEEGTKIYEYGPWKKDVGLFERKVKEYDLSEVEDMPLEEYLKLDLDTLGIEENSYYERKNSLNPSDLYEEVFRVIEKVETLDEKDFIEESDFGGYSFITGFSLMGSLLIWGSYELFVISVITDVDEITFCYSARKLINDIKELSKDSVSLKENKAEIKEKLLELKKLFKDNEKTLEKVKDYYQSIDFGKENTDLLKEKSERIAILKRKIDEQGK